MSDPHRLRQLLNTTLQSAGRQFEEAKVAYANAKSATKVEVPTDQSGRAKIVCRRYAEKRAVRLDNDAKPVCHDAEHRACQGCVEDIQTNCIETW